MGIKNMFKKKEPTEQELREDLNRLGISTRSSNGGRPEKFGAFRNYAQEKQAQKPGFAPVNPYANVNSGGPGNNPYASSDSQLGDGGNPYGNQNNNQQTNSPYGGGQTNSPYGGQQPTNNGSSNPYGASASTPPNPYALATPINDPYARQTTRNTYDRAPKQRQYDEESVLDLNRMPSNIPTSKKPIKRPAFDEELTLDLNELPEEEDLNLDLDELPEEEQINSEDEEVEAIRQDIRFTKQESVALTRNTLRMAQEADASGTNTLGMLGSQSERLYNAEQNLLLADTQTKIAQDKVEQLRRLNRSIFIPATSVNPFNKKGKLRQRELKLKTEKAQEKYLRETNRKGVYDSEQRIKEGITNNATNSEVHQKYQGAKLLEAAQRYQFENDSEDDEMEKELASNLDQIAAYLKKLKSSARTMGQEVESQNERLRKIEDDADRLDINVHLNNTRLSNIR